MRSEFWWAKLFEVSTLKAVERIVKGKNKQICPWYLLSTTPCKTYGEVEVQLHSNEIIPGNQPCQVSKSPTFRGTSLCACSGLKPGPQNVGDLETLHACLPGMISLDRVAMKAPYSSIVS
jgi:hypothetical protein